MKRGIAAACVVALVSTALTIGCGAANAGSPGAETGGADSGVASDGGSTKDSAAPLADGGVPAGWLYTESGKIFVSNGSGGTPWMGRGVNMDDLYLCGYDNALQMQGQTPTAEDVLKTEVATLVNEWKPTFVRVSLSMNSFPTVSTWLADDAKYKTPMVNVIRALGSHPGVYVLVTLRTDASMIGQDPADKEATAVPSSAATTPDSVKFPSGTDAVYQALVDTFSSDAFVLFGISNEPGGNAITKETLVPAMSHAVGVIRAEEDRLGVPHHLVSVQGTGYTAKIDFYAASPLPFDDVVYEVHGYPPAPADYTYANIPVILGEYGTLSDANAFFADVEAKQIPNLAWDFEPYSDCKPDLTNLSFDATNITPSAWGTTVQTYLTSHAK